MKSYTWIVLTKCTPGFETEYERWYDDVHIPDLLRVPGVVAATRGRIADVQSDSSGAALRLVPTPSDAFSYLATYKLEADDPRDVLSEIIARAETPAMPLSEYLGETSTILYEDIQPLGSRQK